MKIGIDLGGSHIAVGLVDCNNEIIEKRTFFMSDNKDMNTQSYIVTSIIHGINEIFSQNRIQLEQVELIGIATPGNPRDGIVKNVVNLNMQDFYLESELRKYFGDSNISIQIQNDGKCAALAEKKYGSLMEYSDCVFLCIGTGIGGAAFIDNEFLRPRRNSGFEFGHMVIKKDGIQCNCGNRGCFEAYCSKKKFKEELQAKLQINEYIGAKDLITLIKKYNEAKENKMNEIMPVIDEYVDNLAIGISNIINILEPEAISIGGSMSHYDELLFDKLKNKIYNGEYLFNKENPPRILAAKAGNDAGIIGATIKI